MRTALMSSAALRMSRQHLNLRAAVQCSAIRRSCWVGDVATWADARRVTPWARRGGVNSRRGALKRSIGRVGGEREARPSRTTRPHIGAEGSDPDEGRCHRSVLARPGGTQRCAVGGQERHGASNGYVAHRWRNLSWHRANKGCVARRWRSLLISFRVRLRRRTSAACSYHASSALR